MKRNLLIVAVLLIAIVASMAGAQARRRQSCVVYTVGVLSRVVTTPEVCVPCVMGQPLCAPPTGTLGFDEAH